jgi:RND family efflux transporter MFP subunit
MKKILLPIAVLVVAVAIAFSFVTNQRELAPQPSTSPPISVRVVEVSPGPVRLSVHAQGTVSPRTESDLVPEVSGNVTWISPNLVSGGFFEIDETLLRIDTRDYEAAVARAEATLDRAIAENELAQLEYSRAQDLAGRELISRAELQTADRSARVTQASLLDAQLVLESARRDLARTELKAPFSGLVRSEQVDVGQFVNRGTAIATV